jgi:hypothetical protein
VPKWVGEGGSSAWPLSRGGTIVLIRDPRTKPLMPAGFRQASSTKQPDKPNLTFLRLNGLIQLFNKCYTAKM